MTFYYTIREIDGLFYINEEEEGFESRQDALNAIERHCEDECADFEVYDA